MLICYGGILTDILALPKDKKIMYFFNSLNQSRLGEGSSVVQDEAEDGEEEPLVRHRSKRTASGSVEPSREAGSIEPTPPSSPEQHDSGNRAQHDGNVFASEEVSFFSFYSFSVNEVH